MIKVENRGLQRDENKNKDTDDYREKQMTTKIQITDGYRWLERYK